MDSILQTDYLPDAIKSNTDQFLTENFPQIIKTITRKPDIASWKDEILKKSVEFIKFGLKKNVESLYNALILLLNPKAIFYKENSKSNYSSKFSELYLGYFKKLEKEFIPTFFTGQELSINHYQFLFKVYSTFYEDKFFMTNNISSNFMEHAQDPFIEFLHSINDLHEISPKTLQNTLDSFISIFSKKLNEVPTSKLFDFLIEWLKSSIFDKQTISAKTISAFFDKFEKKKDLIDNSTIKSIGIEILDIISSSKLKPEIVALLIPFLETIKLFDIFIFSHIIGIYHSVSQAHETEQSPIYSFIAESMHFFPKEAQEMFIDFVFHSPFQPNSYLFLRKFTKELWSTQKDKALFYIFLIQKRAETDESARDTILKIYQQTVIPNEAKICMIQSMLQNFQDHKTAEFAEQVLLLAINLYSNIREVFTDEINASIFKIMNFENREHIFKILTLLIEKGALKLTEPDLEKLISFGKDDCIWIFYKRIINSGKISKINNEYSVIVKHTEEFVVDNPTTFCFMDFLISLIIFDNGFKSSNLNQSDKPKIDFQKSHFTKRKIKFINLFFKAFLSAQENDGSVKLAENFLLDSLNKNNIIPSDIINIITYINDDDSSTSRCLKLLLKLIKKSEIEIDPEDFGKPRHQYPSHYILIHCLYYMEEKCKLHIDPECQLSVLLKRIAVFEKDDKVTSTTYSSSQYLNKSLLSLGINNGTKFKYSKDHKTVEYPKPLSLCLVEKGFVSQLLELSDTTNQEIRELIQELLNYLPTVGIETKITNVKECIVFLQTNEANYARKKYFLQYLITQMKDHKANSLFNQYIESGITSAIGNLLATHDDPFLFEALSTFYDKKYYEKHLNSLLSTIFESIVQNKLTKYTFKLLSKLYSSFSDECYEYFQDNIQQFITSIIEVPPAFISNYMHFMKKIKPNFLFNISKDYLNTDQKNLSLFMKIMAYSLKDKEKIKNFQSIDELFYDNIFKLIKSHNVYQYIGDLIRIIERIIIVSESIRTRAKRDVQIIYDLVFDIEDEEVQSSLFKVLQIIDHENTCNKIKVLFENPDTLDRWNYMPSFFEKDAPYCGLRNLGATCFFNSIIQQLFHIFPVQLVMATHKYEPGSELILLSKLFLQMKYSKRKFCDTLPFIDQWNGWFGEKIRTREQQDAVEFFDILLDQLPRKIQEIFTGKLKNTLTRQNGEFYHADTEPFVTIGVEIKNCSELKQSLEQMLKPEVVESQDEVTNQKIKVNKSIQITSAPPVVVIHLKRFEYNIKERERLKLDKVFKFPLDKLDIGFLCKESNEAVYTLNGIIVHSGTAIGGHYTSFVKINGQWWKFNDTEVVKVSKKDVESSAYGGNSLSSAYALFYVNTNRTIDFQFDDIENHQISFNTEIDYSKYCNPRDLNEINEDNTRFKQTQTIFKKPVFNFVMNKVDIQLNLLYYINIICHSENKYDSKGYVDTVIKRIKKFSLQSIGLEYLLEHKNLVFDGLFHCMHQDITQGLSSIIVECSKNDISICKPMLEFLLQYPYAFRQTPIFFNTLYNIVQPNVKLALEQKIFEKIPVFINLVYSDPKENLLSQLDFTFLFKTIKLLYQEDKSLDVNQFKDYDYYIKKSSLHVDSYNDIYKTGILQKAINSLFSTNSINKSSTKATSTPPITNASSSPFKEPTYSSKNSNTISSTLFSLKNTSNSNNKSNSAKFVPSNKPNNIKGLDLKNSSTTTNNIKNSKKNQIDEKDIKNIVCELEDFLLHRNYNRFKDLLKNKVRSNENILNEVYQLLFEGKAANNKLIDNFLKGSPDILIDFLTHSDSRHRESTFKLYVTIFTSIQSNSQEQLYLNFEKYLKDGINSRINDFYNRLQTDITEKNAFLDCLCKLIADLIIKCNKTHDEHFATAVFDTLHFVDGKNVGKDLNLYALLELYSLFDQSIIIKQIPSIIEMVMKQNRKTFCSILKLYLKQDNYQISENIILSDEFRKYLINGYQESPSYFGPLMAYLKKEFPSLSSDIENIFSASKTSHNNKSPVSEFQELMKDKKFLMKDPTTVFQKFFEIHQKKLISQIPSANFPNYTNSLTCLFKSKVQVGKVDFNVEKVHQAIVGNSAPFQKFVYQLIVHLYSYSYENDPILLKLIDLHIKSGIKAIPPAYIYHMMSFLVRYQERVPQLSKAIGKNENLSIKIYCAVCHWYDEGKLTGNWAKKWAIEQISNINRESTEKTIFDEKMTRELIHESDDDTIMKIFELLKKNDRQYSLSVIVGILLSQKRKDLIHQMRKKCNICTVSSKLTNEEVKLLSHILPPKAKSSSQNSKDMKNNKGNGNNQKERKVINLTDSDD
ncbi:hypothetical protein TRFO_11872 [Tritrichomonas foetus]|uniref:USP domain-containing protein n=1 Tax=Tritrichomonas foetus TaxID=1144522 RepID=A0A1J4J879_9EUKA|nr:hypothetical protein TRFO_11872 [Tritrichomonas foetus]|eukprot:OHS93436.1 hypothetical protein TRFO_11872 [Tritrichomonas foetus]